MGSAPGIPIPTGVPTGGFVPRAAPQPLLGPPKPRPDSSAPLLGLGALALVLAGVVAVVAVCLGAQGLWDGLSTPPATVADEMAEAPVVQVPGKMVWEVTSEPGQIADDPLEQVKVEIAEAVAGVEPVAPVEGKPAPKVAVVKDPVPERIKPVVVSEPVVAPAAVEPVAVSKPVTTGQVSVSGDVVPVMLIGEDGVKRSAGKPIPAGTYEAWATFKSMEGVSIKVPCGDVQVRAGETVTIQANATKQTCRVQ